MIPLRRAIQLLCLLLFLLLIVLTAFPLPDWLPVTRVFALDPLLFLGPLLSSGTLITGLSVLLVLFAATAVLGRFFCSHVCPLGTTLDAGRPLVGPSRKKEVAQPIPGKGLHSVKYLLLLLGVLTALFGLNLLHWGSPLSLAARLYILIIQPFLHFLFNWITVPLGWLSGTTGLPGISQAPVQGFPALAFLTCFFAGLLLLNRWIPRFWCRFLCPAGALLGLIGQRPLVRRLVNDSCTQCGLCLRHCPMQAISDNPGQTLNMECIVCQQCRRICPEAAITFSFSRTNRSDSQHLPGRRAALQMVGLGALLAFLGQSGQAERNPASVIRPPGAVPEPLFLSRCLRCGLCLEVCPTNMLQPESLGHGLAAHFAPVAVPRIGPCEPDCNGCTRVCPSGAIRILDLEEKIWAKMGTAYIESGQRLGLSISRHESEPRSETGGSSDTDQGLPPGFSD